MLFLENEPSEAVCQGKHGAYKEVQSFEDELLEAACRGCFKKEHILKNELAEVP